MFEFTAIPRLAVAVVTALITLPLMLWISREMRRRHPDPPLIAIALAMLFIAGPMGLALAGAILIPLELILRLVL